MDIEEQYQNLILDSDRIDIKKYIFLILSKWYLIVISLFIAFSVVYFINRYTEPIYRVSSSIIVSDADNTSSRGDDLIKGLSVIQKGKNIQNEIAILHSFDLNRTVIQELDFRISYFIIGRIRTPEQYGNCPFYVVLDTTKANMENYPINITLIDNKTYKLEINDRFSISEIMKYGEEFSNDNFNFSIYLKEPGKFQENFASKKYFFRINNITSLTNQYRYKLSTVLSSEEGTILNLSIKGYVPKKEVAYLNKLTEVYIRSGLEEKNKIADNTVKFIDNQIAQIIDSLQRTENVLSKFKNTHNFIDINKESEANFTKLEKLEANQTLLNLKLKYYNYLENYINSKNAEEDIIAPSVMGIDDVMLRNLIVKLNELINKKNQIIHASSENNPQLTLINLEIEDAKNELKENIKSLIAANQISSVDVIRQIDTLNRELKDLPAIKQKLLNIQRKFNLNDNIYTYLLEKRAEAGIAKASNIPSVRVLDKARLENVGMISPNRSKNKTVALLIGLIAPLLLILIIDFFNDRILEKKDIERNTKLPIIGAVGHNTKQTEHVVLESPKSSITESFRTVRTNLKYLLVDKGSKVITITSTISGEGKTFCASNLASVIALSGKKTLLVGLDLRKPRIHKQFNVGNKEGLSTYLIGKTPFENLFQPTENENLFITTSGPAPPNPAELIENEKLDVFFNQVRKDFDYIIIDTPPVALVSDALYLNQFSDTNLFVVRQNFSNKSVLGFMNELAENKKMTNMNILVNDVKISSYYGGKYGYGYGYSYYYNYGYGYKYGYGSDYYEDLEADNLLTKILKTLRFK
ncbi:MAG: polysaccharide biosynthesis tyrosine autokinase [Chlorobi bacterium]|nr:polysaccharide biosynthesis tyrosine autokinase [Chlorobiota bacterium]